MAPSPKDELYQLELLSLTGKIATELLNHTGINDRVLAEFILSLHDSATSVADFKSKLSEVGADFPDSFVTNLDRLILRLHPKHKKASSTSANGNGKAGSNSPSAKGKQKATLEDEERERKARMFPGLAIKDQEWEASAEKGRNAVDDFMKDFEDMAAAKSNSRSDGNGRSRDSRSPPSASSRNVSRYDEDDRAGSSSSSAGAATIVHRPTSHARPLTTDRNSTRSTTEKSAICAISVLLLASKGFVDGSKAWCTSVRSQREPASTIHPICFPAARGSRSRSCLSSATASVSP